MTAGDRVVLLRTEERGTILGTTRTGGLLVQLDDSPEAFAVEFNPFDVEVCDVPRRPGLSLPL